MSENIEDGSNGIYSNNPSNFKANSMEIINS